MHQLSWEGTRVSAPSHIGQDTLLTPTNISAGSHNVTAIQPNLMRTQGGVKPSVVHPTRVLPHPGGLMSCTNCLQRTARLPNRVYSQPEINPLILLCDCYILGAVKKAGTD